MSRRSSWPFLGALLSAGAFGLHQARYALAYGGDAYAELSASGHGYLAVAEPVVGLAFAFALAQVVWRMGGGGRRSPTSRSRLAIGLGVAVFVVYTGQELLEGALSSGHVSGLAGVFGGGGWVALPLAAAFGWLLSLAVKVADAAAASTSLNGLAPRAVVASSGAPARPVLLRPLTPKASPIARHLAGRAPPALLSL